MNFKEQKELENLIADIANGDREALSEIYERLGRMIFSIAVGITERKADAEDALQETMIDIVKSAENYKPGTNPKAWILTIARHNAMDMVRKRRDHLPIDCPEAMGIAVDDDLPPDVSDLLSKLNDEERQLIILRIYGELSYIEIGKIMNVSVFAVQKRYQRVLKKLKDYSGGVF